MPMTDAANTHLPLVPSYDLDVDESYIRSRDPDLLRCILLDRSMTARNGRPTNIKWAVDDYAATFPDKQGYSANDEIAIDAISGSSITSRVIVPRVRKRQDEQRRRSAEKAEVFTPSWVCNEQNNLVDETWFGRKDRLFNEPNPDFNISIGLETELRWCSVGGRGKDIVRFPNTKGRTWRDYVKALRLEVACGEAPYLTSRYDTTTGQWIAPRDRIGLLDRKLRVVGERCKDASTWLEWAEEAVKSVYGFEWQGDNVILARENILFAVLESFHSRFNGLAVPMESVRRLAEIISWNIWQMDGIKFVVPSTCHDEVEAIPNLDGSVERNVSPCKGCKSGKVEWHNGVRCRVMDWEIGKPVLFMPPFEFKPIETNSEISGGRNDIA